SATMDAASLKPPMARDGNEAAHARDLIALDVRRRVARAIRHLGDDVPPGIGNQAVAIREPRRAATIDERPVLSRCYDVRLRLDSAGAQDHLPVVLARLQRE